MTASIAVPDSVLAQTNPKPARRPPPGERPQTPRRESPLPRSPASPQGRELPAPGTLLRLSDRRPAVDPAPLRQRGIRRHAGRRLVLWTDVTDPAVAELPGLADAAYDALVTRLGELPPTREGDDFQVTGYLMKDQMLFRELKLLPDDLARFNHGRNRGYEFWLNEQPTPYYRAHLLLHEFTHCYTTVVRHGLLQTGWYMEGIAELFATHAREAEGEPWQFAVWPAHRSQFPGLGRIKLIEEARRAGTPLSLTQVMEQPYERFLEPEAYAWSWALCRFLSGHPRHGEEFLAASRAVTSGDTDTRLRQLLNNPALAREWEWFARDLCHGYDFTRAAVMPPETAPSADESESPDRDPPAMVITADRGWQVTGLTLQADVPLLLEAKGEFQLQPGPKPWISSPAGVSIRYHAGRPLGRLIGRIWPTDPTTPTPDDIDIGSRGKIVPKVNGWLYLRLNDAWDELADNAGEVRVSPRPESP